MRRHLEGAQFQQAQPAGAAESGEYSLSMQNSLRCVLPVTSTRMLRSVRSTIHGGMASPCTSRLRSISLQRDLQLVQLVVARFVHARRLAGRADEHAARTGSSGTGGCASTAAGWPAARACAGTGESAGVAPPSTKWLPPPVPVWRPSVMNFSADRRVSNAAWYRNSVCSHQLAPAVGRMDVDLDHARIGRDLQQLQARVARRRIAFQHDLHAQFLGGGLDGRPAGRGSPPGAPAAA